jgi:hypothetical protein
MERDLEGSGSELFNVLPRNFSVGTEENQERPYSGESVSWLRFEPTLSRIRVYSVRAMSTDVVDAI